MNRREFIKAGTALAMAPQSRAWPNRRRRSIRLRPVYPRLVRTDGCHC